MIQEIKDEVAELSYCINDVSVLQQLYANEFKRAYSAVCKRFDRDEIDNDSFWAIEEKLYSKSESIGNDSVKSICSFLKESWNTPSNVEFSFKQFDENTDSELPMFSSSDDIVYATIMGVSQFRLRQMFFKGYNKLWKGSNVLQTLVEWERFKIWVTPEEHQKKTSPQYSVGLYELPTGNHIQIEIPQGNSLKSIYWGSVGLGSYILNTYDFVPTAKLTRLGYVIWNEINKLIKKNDLTIDAFLAIIYKMNTNGRRQFINDCLFHKDKADAFLKKVK